MTPSKLFHAAAVGIFLLGGCGSDRTSADRYSSREVQEIIKLLRTDVECRDTRLGGWFERRDIVSLELWDAILGKPVSIGGQAGGPLDGEKVIWTFKTRDGAVTVIVGTLDHLQNGNVKFIEVTGNGDSLGFDPNSKVDADSLKKTILRVKKTIDPTDSLEFQKKLLAEHEQDAAEIAKQAQIQQKQAEKDAAIAKEERLLAHDLDQADMDCSFLVSEFAVLSPEHKAIMAQWENWRTRRAKLITEARKKGLIVKAQEDTPYWDNFTGPGIVPMPNVDAVRSALRDGRPIPVGAADVDVAKEKPVEDVEQQPPADVPRPPKEDAPPDEKLPAVVEGEKGADQAQKALAKKIKLVPPYPAAEKGAPTDRISIQYAVKEITRQAGLGYDFKASLRNTDPVCKQWVKPRINNKTCRDSLKAILDPVGLTYKIDNGQVILERR